MLEGLDRVEWDRLTQESRPPSDFPTRIRELASSEEETWLEALRVLSDWIYGASIVEEALAFAVPFLIELVGYESVRSRREILVLLGDIDGAAASSLAAQERRENRDQPSVSDAEGQRQRVERERAWLEYA